MRPLFNQVVMDSFRAAAVASALSVLGNNVGQMAKLFNESRIAYL